MLQVPLCLGELFEHFKQSANKPSPVSWGVGLFILILRSFVINVWNQLSETAYFDSLRPGQHFFSHVGTDRPVLNQY